MMQSSVYKENNYSSRRRGRILKNHQSLFSTALTAFLLTVHPTFGAADAPGDAYFALDRVLDASIEISPEDWDRLWRAPDPGGALSALTESPKRASFYIYLETLESLIGRPGKASFHSAGMQAVCVSVHGPGRGRKKGCENEEIDGGAAWGERRHGSRLANYGGKTV